VIDLAPHQMLLPAPYAVFDALSERASRPRFILADGTVITWGAFADQIRRATMFLDGCGFRTGDRAAIFAANRVEWMSSALAIQSAGGVMVPVYPSSTAEQAAYVIRHSDARVLFVDGAALLAKVFESWNELASVERVVLLDASLDANKILADLASKGRSAPTATEAAARLVTWERALALGENTAGFDAKLASVRLDAPGMMLYTSGTSGNPKGVPLTHENVAVNGRDWLNCNAPQLEEGMVDLLWLPMSHIFGFGEACLGNALGWTTYLTDPMTVLDRLPVVRPSVFMSVPSLWEKLAMAAATESDPQKQKTRLAEVTGGKLRFCLSGGAGLKREVKELLHTCGVLVLEGYGLTECSPTLTLNRPDSFRFDTVGKPVPSVELKLAEDGEILARGKSVFSGYHKDPDATRECFTEDGWFKTGDVGRFTEDGFLQIIDRKKDILVTAGGKNVPPANIELKFRDDPFVAHVVVYGEAKRYLVAGVWLNDAAVGAHLAAQGVDPAAQGDAVRALVQSRIDRVNAELASYESLKKFAVMSRPLTLQDGFLTPTLKVRRRFVYESFRGDFEGLYA